MSLLLTLWTLLRGVARAIPLTAWLIVGAGAGGFVVGHRMASKAEEVRSLKAKAKLAEADLRIQKRLAEMADEKAKALATQSDQIQTQLAEIQAENAKLPVEKRCPLGPDRARRLRELGLSPGEAGATPSRLRSPRLRFSTHGGG